MRSNLDEDPAVISIAETLKIPEVYVVGLCWKLWRWADEQTINGCAHGVTDSWVDRYTGATGFAQAMVKVGWLDFTNGSMSIPKFDRHISNSAKSRALSQRRMEKSRYAQSATEAQPEKRREENNKYPPNPPKGEGQEHTKKESKEAPDSDSDVEEFIAAWNQLGPPFCVIRDMTPSRRRRLCTRLRDAFWRGHWRAALTAMPGRPFLRGEGDKSWIADVDFFLKGDTVAKILEGKYQTKTQQEPKRRTRADIEAEQERDRRESASRQPSAAAKS